MSTTSVRILSVLIGEAVKYDALCNKISRRDRRLYSVKRFGSFSPLRDRLSPKMYSAQDRFPVHPGGYLLKPRLPGVTPVQNAWNGRYHRASALLSSHHQGRHYCCDDVRWRLNQGRNWSQSHCSVAGQQTISSHASCVTTLQY